MNRTTFSFDLLTLEFYQRKSMITGRWKHALAWLDGNLIYILGGIQGKVAVRNCMKYEM